MVDALNKGQNLHGLHNGHRCSCRSCWKILSFLTQLQIIWVAFGMGKNFSYWQINTICHNLGKEKSLGLPFFHTVIPFVTPLHLSSGGRRSWLRKHGNDSQMFPQPLSQSHQVHSLSWKVCLLFSVVYKDSLHFIL